MPRRATPVVPPSPPGGARPMGEVLALSAAMAALARERHDFAEVFRSPDGSLSLTVARWPAGSTDDQTPHTEDEVYHVTAGRAVLVVAGERRPVAARCLRGSWRRAPVRRDRGRPRDARLLVAGAAHQRDPVKLSADARRNRAFWNELADGYQAEQGPQLAIDAAAGASGRSPRTRLTPSASSRARTSSSSAAAPRSGRSPWRAARRTRRRRSTCPSASWPMPAG